jgi:hypothetical protein
VYNVLMNKQSGYSTAQVVMAVVAAFVIGFGGWFLLHAKQQADQNNNSQVNTDQYKNAAPGKLAQVDVINKSSTPGSKVATDFYKKYLNAGDNRTDIVAQYGTTALSGYYQSHPGGNDAFSCIMEVPSTVEITSQAADASDESLTVTVSSDSVGALEVPVKAVLQGNDWKLDSITCP